MFLGNIFQQKKLYMINQEELVRMVIYRGSLPLKYTNKIIELQFSPAICYL